MKPYKMMTVPVLSSAVWMISRTDANKIKCAKTKLLKGGN